jgi:NAD(P)H dehydrogenase (quinone)
MLISANQAWGRHRSEVSEEPTATLDDLEWADGVAFGTPSRFGNVAAQLKMFLDQAGELWEQGKLINKVATAFVSSQTAHGGQESTILALNNTFYHWGAIVLPLGYTIGEVFNGGGNPYGASYTSGTRVGAPDAKTVAVAVAQGGRLARVARAIGVAQERGLLDARCSVVTSVESRRPRPLGLPPPVTRLAPLLRREGASVAALPLGGARTATGEAGWHYSCCSRSHARRAALRERAALTAELSPARS